MQEMKVEGFNNMCVKFTGNLLDGGNLYLLLLHLQIYHSLEYDFYFSSIALFFNLSLSIFVHTSCLYTYNSFSKYLYIVLLSIFYPIGGLLQT